MSLYAWVSWRIRIDACLLAENPLLKKLLRTLTSSPPEASRRGLEHPSSATLMVRGPGYGPTQL